MIHKILKIYKLDFIKIQFFYSEKVTMKRMKQPAAGREKIFVKHISDKELMFKIYKVLSKLNNKKTNNYIF